MTYSKIDTYRISILAMICFFVCFTKVDQATANLVPGEITCWVCEEKFDDISKSCPRCGAPVKQGITRATRGSVRDKAIQNFVVNFMEVYLRENGMQMAIKMLVDRLEYAEVNVCERLILINYDSWIADIRRSGEKGDNYYKKKFDAEDLLRAIDTAKRFKGHSESAERLKNVIISEEPEGYWDRIRALIKANPHLVDDYIALRKLEREEEVARLEKFKQVSQEEKFKKDLEVIINEAKKQILEEKQKYLLNLKK